MSRHAQDERRDLCALFLEVGPDAPTLCEGWRTLDLASHLILRERRPDAAAGIVIGPLSGYTERVQRQVRGSDPWPVLVARVRGGPPLFLRPLDELMNTVEYFVHHEDVRRARPEWRPRELPTDLEATLWQRVKAMAKLTVRRAPVGVVLEAAGFGRAQASARTPSVIVRGRPGELLLFASGRHAAAKVSFEGEDRAVTQLRAARFGL